MDKLKVIKYHINWEQVKRAHSTDAGLDCHLPEKVTLKPGVNKIPLGFGIILDEGYMAQIIERSSNAMQGLIFAKAPIDAGYTGQVHAIVFNMTNEDIVFEQGDRLGQLVISQVWSRNMISDYTYNVPKTQRGNNGFGSTGK